MWQPTRALSWQLLLFCFVTQTKASGWFGEICSYQVRLACLMATNLNLSRVEIEGDNKSIIHLCVSETDPPWESGFIISNVRRMVALGQFSVLWCPRTANGATHWTARAFRRNSLPVSWVSSPPDGLRDLMEQYPINHNESMVKIIPAATSISN